MADTVKEKLNDVGKVASEAAENVGEPAKASANKVAASPAEAIHVVAFLRDANQLSLGG